MIFCSFSISHSILHSQFTQVLYANRKTRACHLRVTKGSHQVKLSMGKHDERAVISKSGAHVVRDAQILEKKMTIFGFKEHEKGSPDLNMFTGIPFS